MNFELIETEKFRETMEPIARLGIPEVKASRRLPLISQFVLCSHQHLSKSHPASLRLASWSRTDQFLEAKESESDTWFDPHYFPNHKLLNVLILYVGYFS